MVDRFKELVNSQVKDREKNTKLFISKLRRILDNYLPEVLDFEDIDLNEAASVIGGLQSGLNEAGLSDVIAELNEAYNDELVAINNILKGSVEGKIFSTADKEVVETLIDYNSDKIRNLVSPYIDDVGSTVLRYAVTGETPDVQEIVAKSAGAIESQISTEVETLLSGFSRTITAKKADEFNLDLFMYYGPEDKITRDFCADLLKDDPSIYKKEEILQMDNGQGLDVLTNCGGYNCRHQWVPITLEKALSLGYKV